jgi:hypothetical protein
MKPEDELRVLRAALADLATQSTRDPDSGPNSEPQTAPKTGAKTLDASVLRAFERAGGDAGKLRAIVVQREEQRQREIEEEEQRRRESLLNSKEEEEDVGENPAKLDLLSLPDDLLSFIAFQHCPQIGDVLRLGASCRRLARLVLSPSGMRFQRHEASLGGEGSRNPLFFEGAGLEPASSEAREISGSSNDSSADSAAISVLKLARQGAICSSARPDADSGVPDASVRTALMGGLALCGVSPSGGRPGNAIAFELHWQSRFFRDFPYLTPVVPPGNPELLWCDTPMGQQAVAFARANPPTLLPDPTPFRAVSLGPQLIGASEQEFRNRLQPTLKDLSGGTRVYARWRRDNGTVYTGVVKKLNGQGADIAYDDGDFEAAVPLHRLRLRASDKLMNEDNKDDTDDGDSDGDDRDARGGKKEEGKEDALRPMGMSSVPLRFRWPLAFDFPLDDLLSRDFEARKRAAAAAERLEPFGKFLCTELLRQRLAELDAERTGEGVWRKRYEFFARGLTRYRVELCKDGELEACLVRKDRHRRVDWPKAVDAKHSSMFSTTCPHCHLSADLDELSFSGLAPRKSSRRRTDKLSLLSSDSDSSGSDDETEGTASPASAPHQMGDVVRARWSRGGEYRGTVSMVNSDGT